MSCILAMLVLAGTASCVAAGFNYQASAVHIVFPATYRDKIIDMSIADFGKPLYGASLMGQLVYPSEDAAYNPAHKPMRCPGVACEYACGRLDAATPPFVLQKQLGQLVIMLLDRGPRDTEPPCYFLNKVYNAQLAGADAVLLVNDEDGALSTAVVPDEPAVAKLIESLHISAAVISKQDGALLKTLLLQQSSVTLSINWTNILPKSAQVSWELWTTTNDQCGAQCDAQQAFIKAMKPYARALQQKGLLSFSPHYMLWSCPTEYLESDQCMTECVMNGQYCVPDPDSSLLRGYQGKEVLAMNVRHMCFAQAANASGLPWAWWDYAEAFAANCTSKGLNFTVACADQVRVQQLAAWATATSAEQTYQTCLLTGLPPSNSTGSTNATLPLLEQELMLQSGTIDVPAVSILPTVRINGQQYRGNLEVSSVMRALCSAFPTDSEPALCNEKWVADDECEPSGIGAKNCQVGNSATGGRTRCLNTFSGYKCECGQGWVRGVKADTQEEVCEDLNECLATNVRLTDPACGCTRCACVNLEGGYRCTGPLEDQCTAANGYGGCWNSVVEGKTVHACVDKLQEFQRNASRGMVANSQKWYGCQCPPCWQVQGGSAAGNPACSPLCPASQCLGGQCVSVPSPSMAPGTGGQPLPTPTGGSSSGSHSAGSLLLTVALTVGITTGILAALYQFVLRQRMQGEVQALVRQYLPLGPKGPAGSAGWSGGGALPRVLEADEEEGEDMPLMASTADPRAAQFGAAGTASEARAATAYQPALGPATHSAKTGSYQPPVLPDDEYLPGSGPLNLVATSGRSARHAAGGVEREAGGNGPVLGDGPL